MVDKLNNAKSEYFKEMLGFNISAKDLIEKKIPIDIIKIEHFLEQIYGDKIYISSSEKLNELSEKKTVQKISASDMGVNLKLEQIAEMIDDSQFDRELERLLK